MSGHSSEAPFGEFVFLEVAHVRIDLRVHKWCVILESNFSSANSFQTGRSTSVNAFRIFLWSSVNNLPSTVSCILLKISKIH